MMKIIRGVLSICAVMIFIVLAGPSAATAQTFGGNVGFSWNINNAPKSGLTDITFTTKFNPDTAHTGGTYVADQFQFAGVTGVGYIGLQPRSNKGDKTRLHAVFSSFISGTKSTDGQCSDGADGGPGVSCGATFTADYSHAFELTVTRTDTDTWTGTAKDTATGVTTHLGTYVLPAKSGNLRSSQVGFVENYNTKSCETVPRIDVSVGAPKTSSGLVGKSTQAHEYGACKGKANYSSSVEGKGLLIKRGWK